jgi:hypothetical protein
LKFNQLNIVLIHYRLKSEKLFEKTEILFSQYHANCKDLRSSKSEIVVDVLGMVKLSDTELIKFL